MAMIEKKSLVLMRDVDGVAKAFPLDSAPAILGTFTYTGERMGGAPSITATLMYPRCLDDEWTYKEYVEFRGEKFYVRSIPTSSKSNEDLFYKHEVTLVSERDILEHVLFYDAVTDRTEELYKDRYRTNNTKLSFYGDIVEFVSRLNDSLVYSGLSDYTVKIYDGTTSESKTVSFEDEFIIDAIQEIHETFELQYRFIGKTCYVGENPNELISEPILEYGIDNGLLSITKTNSENDIVNRITGEGSSDNIPYYYPNSNPYGIAIFKAERGGDDITENISSVDLEKLLRYVSDPINTPLTYIPKNTSFTKWDESERREIFLSQDYPTPNASSEDNYVTKPFLCTVNCKGGSNVHLTITAAIYVDGEYIGGNGNVGLDVFYIDGVYRSVPSGNGWSYTRIGKYYSQIGYYINNIGNDFSDRTITITPIVIPDGVDKWDTEYYKRVTVRCSVSCVITNSDGNAGRDYGFETDDGEFARPSDIGLVMTEGSELAVGDVVTVIGRKWINPTGALMPSIFRETEGAVRFYNAIDGKYDAPDDADDDEKDSDGKYIFTNPYVEGNPHEAKYDCDDIKPTIVGVKNASGLLFGEIVDVEFDKNDSDLLSNGNDTDETSSDVSNYLHPYFYIKLNQFDGNYAFNLFEQAIASTEAYIEMTSGNCAGCKFQIGVHYKVDETGKAYKFYNPVLVDDNGDIVSGNFNDKIVKESEVDKCQAIQQDTRNAEVWICVKKETDTFGIIMPNATNNYKPSGVKQNPQGGDTFVITGISLPDELVYAAEKELEEELIRYMKENNDEHFTFSVTFSRIWLATHPNFTNKINENSILSFIYNDRLYKFFVSSYTCKADDNILYEITVELTDSIAVTQSSLTSTVESIAEGVYSNLKDKDGASVQHQILGKYYLRKDKADTATGLLSLLGGVVVDKDNHGINSEGRATTKELTTDSLSSSSATLGETTITALVSFLSQKGTTGDFGTGFAAFLTSAGAGRIETDELLVRNKAIFNELEIRKLSYTGGNIVLSPAGSVIERVTYITADGTEYEADENGLYVDASGNTVTPVTYRCYYKADDGTTATTNTWKEGDQARCQTFNLADISTHEATTNHFYWRLVTAVGNDYIDLSASDCADNSDAPAAQDTLVQMGNRYSENADRQGFIYLQSEGTYAPCIEEYAGVNSYSLDGKVLTRISPTHPEGNLFTGKFQIVSGGQIVKQAVYRGDYDATATYEYYDQVTYNGDLWLCIVPEGKTATEAPSITSQQWKRQTDRDTDKAWTIDATLDGSEYIAESETRTLSASLLYGTDVMNSEVTDGWRIERDSGDAEADAVWNADAAHNGLSKEEALSYQFSQSDLNGKDSARFTIYASASLIPTNVVVLTAEDGTTYYTDETGITYTL